jgi:hypothetical protein
MSIIRSKSKPVYRFAVGDIIGASEAARLLGYDSPRNLQGNRLNSVVQMFVARGCTLTANFFVCGRRRFLRSEIDAYLAAELDAARAESKRMNEILRLAV